MVACLWSASVFVLPAKAASADPLCPWMFTWNETHVYHKGQFCLSNDTDLLTYQTDGNLVWYINGVAQWSSNTYGRGDLLALQGDGNVVIYSSSGTPLYASSWGHNAAVFTTPDQLKYLSVSNASHLHSVTHQIDLRTVGTNTYAGGSALNGLQWEELGTQPNGCTFEVLGIDTRTPARTLAPTELCWTNPNGTLVFQNDGNFVEYVGGKARWSSGTWGRGARLAFQSDGNIVIYNAAGAPIWAVSWLAPGWQPRDLTHGNGYIHLEVIPSGAINYESWDNVHSAKIYWNSYWT